MGPLPEDEGLYDPADGLCRRCGSAAAQPTVDSNFGRYMRCDDCGEIWHAERRLQTIDTAERRRRTDMSRQAASGGTSAPPNAKI